VTVTHVRKENHSNRTGAPGDKIAMCVPSPHFDIVTWINRIHLIQRAIGVDVGDGVTSSRSAWRSLM